MQEIKCPKCGEVFQVDESGYAAIVKQVRDKEFSQELQSREIQFETEKENAVQLAILEAEKKFNETLNSKLAEISELKNKLVNFDKDKELEINKLISKLKGFCRECEHKYTCRGGCPTNTRTKNDNSYCLYKIEQIGVDK